MSRHRLAAALLVALEGAVVGYEFQRPGFTALALVVAAVGATGRVRLHLGKRIETAFAFLLAVALTAHWQLATPPPIGSALLPDGLAYALARFFLLLQAAQLFTNREGVFDWPFALPGTAALTVTGDLMASDAARQVFHAGSLAFVGLLAALFATAGATRPVRAPRAGRLRRRAAHAGVLLAAALLALAGSWLLGTYKEELNDVFNNLVTGDSRPAGLGFSDQARLGLVGYFQGLAPDATALRVRSRSAPGYLRSKTYDRLTGARWSTSVTIKSVTPLPSTSERKVFRLVPGSGDVPPREKGISNSEYRMANDEGRKGTSPFDMHSISAIPAALGETGVDSLGMEVTPVMDSSGVLFAPLGTGRMAVGTDQLLVGEDGTARRTDGRASEAYELLPGEDAAMPPPSGEYRKALLSLPEELDPGIRALAEGLFAGKRTTEGKVRAAVEYFRANYRYRLGLSVPPGKDPLAYLLLEHPPAHCEYFASGAVVLLRLAGVPCRYVTGFVATDYNTLAGTWTARHRDAHAWVEVWDAARGWVTVEPTVADGLPTPPAAGTARSLAHLWDYLKDLPRRARLALGGLLRVLRASGIGSWLVMALAVAFLGIAGRGLVARARRPSAEASAKVPPEVERMRREMAQLDRRVRAAGFTRAPNETLHRFAARLEAGAAEQPEPRRASLLRDAAGWYRRYAVARYGGAEDARPPTGRA